VTEQDLGRGAAGRTDPGVVAARMDAAAASPGPLLPVPPVASVWNVANALTAVRVLLVPIFGLLLLRGRSPEHHLRIVAAAVFVVAALTDLLDGELARRHSLITDVGKIADPIADKALIGTALVGLSLLGELPWWVTAVVLARELGVTLLRLVVLRHGVLPAGRGGKAKTLVQALAITMYLLPLPAAAHGLALVTMAAAVALTVVTGVDYVIQAARLTAGSERTLRRRAERRGPS
jgi:CDP-diacylglycerol---glycerol-3-phosphate 3-phosphatidyltransferase